jgi:hypothetical protein
MNLIIGKIDRGACSRIRLWKLSSSFALDLRSILGHTYPVAALHVDTELIWQIWYIRLCRVFEGLQSLRRCFIGNMEYSNGNYLIPERVLAKVT